MLDDINNYLVRTEFAEYAKEVRNFGAGKYPSVAGLYRGPNNEIGMRYAHYHIILIESEDIFNGCWNACRNSPSADVPFSSMYGVSAGLTASCPGNWDLGNKIHESRADWGIFSGKDRFGRDMKYMMGYRSYFPLGNKRLLSFRSDRLGDCSSPTSMLIDGNPRKEKFIEELLKDHPNCPSLGVGWYSNVTPEQVRAKYFPEDVE